MIRSILAAVAVALLLAAPAAASRVEPRSPRQVHPAKNPTSSARLPPREGVRTSSTTRRNQ